MREQPVTVLKAGDKARVVAIAGQDAGYIRKLTVFGLLPGADIEVMQTFPAYVLSIGNTQLALDREIATGIIVVKCQQDKKK
ncbi:FeoA family protein [Sporomusa aerivorans]|uniref:FeoA family protein n=1 Tax=Sporomusa aerivorans TaxID=204936 RepID=UPI00352A5A26